MKSRFTTYLLAVAVLILWGIIIKKIFFRPSSEEVGVSAGIPAPKIEGKDTLYLNYRDPFGVARKPVRSEMPATRPDRQPPAKRPRENIKINFIGWLQCGKYTNYIVDINGRQHSLSPGDEADGLRLVKAQQDSLYFKKDNQTYPVAITH